MNVNDLPAPVLAKLLTLNKAIEDLTDRVARTEDAINTTRARLTGGFTRDNEYRDVRGVLDQAVSDLPILQKTLHAARYTLSRCKEWLDQLPRSSSLEGVEVNVAGQSLDDVQARLSAAQDELKELRAMPVPSADVRQRVEGYVREMARPTITGIGEGEQLKIVWAGAGWNSAGPIENRAEVLPLIALLHPEAMVEALMREVERMSGGSMPLAARKRRIAELEDEVEELQRQALALGAEPSADFAPWVLLGVRIAASKSSRAA